MADAPKRSDGRIDIDQPRWNQQTFLGRLKHFAWITDYRTVVVPESRLLEAKQLLEQYRLDIYI